MLHRAAVTIAIIAAAQLACESKPPAPAHRSHLVEVSSATSLAPVRAAFNAHRGEARFLTLLSPT